MAQLITAFNAQQYDPSQGVVGLPVGRHPVVIESSEVKANSNNDGGYLQLNLKVIDGPNAGTVGAYRLNLYHSNQQTIEIAHRQFSAVCHVVGVFNVQDSAQLHGIPFLVEVGQQKSNPQYTEVKKVFDINGNEPGKAGQPAPAAQPQAAQTGFAAQQQQPQAQQPAQQPAWGQQQPQQAATQPAAQQAPAWGVQGGQPAQTTQAQQPAWQQGASAPAQAPWGQK